MIEWTPDPAPDRNTGIHVFLWVKLEGVCLGQQTVDSLSAIWLYFPDRINLALFLLSEIGLLIPNLSVTDISFYGIYLG